MMSSAESVFQTIQTSSSNWQMSLVSHCGPPGRLTQMRSRRSRTPRGGRHDKFHFRRASSGPGRHPDISIDDFRARRDILSSQLHCGRCFRPGRRDCECLSGNHDQKRNSGRLTEREEFLRPRTELNDWSSYFLNNISVSIQFRRRGVVSMLLTAVVEEARSRNFPSVTLHVWADQGNARAFYRKASFRQDGWAPIPWHIDLPHEGGSLLLKLRLRKLHRATQQRKRG